MGRAIYPHELGDPDYAWLINSFRENNPGCLLVEATTLPMVFIREEKRSSEHDLAALAAIPTQAQELDSKDKPISK